MLDISSWNAICLSAERWPKADDIACPATAEPIDFAPATTALLPNSFAPAPMMAERKGCMSDKRSNSSIGLYMYLNIRIRSGRLDQGLSKLALVVQFCS